MRIQIAAFALVAAAAAAPVAAQSPAAPESPSKTAAAKVDPNKMVCRSFDTTGSRLGKRRECRTAAAWAEQSALDRREVERQQASRWKND